MLDDFDLNEAWKDALEWDPQMPWESAQDVATAAADNAESVVKWQTAAAAVAVVAAAYVAAKAIPEVGGTVRGVAKDLGAANLLKAIGL